MKKSILLLFLTFALSISIYAQGTNVLINGLIKNPLSTYVVFDRLEAYYNGEVDYKPDTVYLKPNGYFEANIRVTKPTYYNFIHGKEYSVMYLEPGFKLFINIDANLFDENLVYTDKGAFSNNYLAKKFLLEENVDTLTDIRKLYGRSRADFLSYVNTLDTIYSQKLRSYMESVKTMSPKFVENQKAANTFVIARKKILYPHYYKAITKKPLEDPAGDYYNFMKAVPLNNPEYLQLEEFISFINDFVMVETSKKIQSDTLITYRMARKEVIDKNFTDPLIREYLWYDMIRDILTMESVADNQALIDEYYTFSKNKIFQKDLESIIEQKKPLEPGNPAPSIQAVNFVNFSSNLSDLSGHPVYAVFWASSNGNSLVEMSSFDKLKMEYESSGIIFLKLSIDKDKKAWEKSMKIRTLSEDAGRLRYNWYLGENPRNKELLNYQVNSLPRYIMINADGTIYNAYAPRPSSRNIVEELNKLLEK